MQKATVTQINAMILKATGSAAAIIFLSWFSLSAIGADMQTNLSVSVKKVVKQSMAEEMKFLRDFVYTRQLINIEKQAFKIKSDPDDLKLCDIRLAVQEWAGIPVKYKTALVVQRFDTITKWTKSHPLF